MLLFPASAALAAFICVIIHYELLRLLSCGTTRLPIPPRSRIICVVAGAFGSHLIQIMFFALVLWALTIFASIGILGSNPAEKFQQSLYVSFESYASLGTAETFPFGPLRLFTGIEGLSGLVLVGWTSAYTYWCMREFWNDH